MNKKTNCLVEGHKWHKDGMMIETTTDPVLIQSGYRKFSCFVCGEFSVVYEGTSYLFNFLINLKRC